MAQQEDFSERFHLMNGKHRVVMATCCCLTVSDLYAMHSKFIWVLIFHGLVIFSQRTVW